MRANDEAELDKMWARKMDDRASCQGSDAFIQCVIDANEKHGGFNSDPRHVVFKQSIPKGLFRLRTPTSGR